MACTITREWKEVWRVSIEGAAPRDFDSLADAREWLDWRENNARVTAPVGPEFSEQA